MSLDNLLRNTILADVAEIWDNPLVFVSPESTVLETLQTLASNRITSAPILDEDGDAFGSIDMLDLVGYAVQKLDPEWTSKPISEERIQEFLSKVPVINLMDISRRNGYISIPAHKSVSKAKNFLTHPNIHRVYVTDPDNYMRPIGVLTQSKFIDFILEHFECVKDKLAAKIGQVFPEQKDLVTVDLNDPLLTAFRRIYEFKVSGVPVVNSNGEMVANISATDLKFIDFSNPSKMMHLLQRPISEFLSNPCVTEEVQMVASLNQVELFYAVEKKPHLKPVVVKADDSLETALLQADAIGVHRIYQIDENNKPIRVLSLSDMAKAVCFDSKQHKE